MIGVSYSLVTGESCTILRNFAILATRTLCRPASGQVIYQSRSPQLIKDHMLTVSIFYTRAAAQYGVGAGTRQKKIIHLGYKLEVSVVSFKHACSGFVCGKKMSFVVLCIFSVR